MTEEPESPDKPKMPKEYRDCSSALLRVLQSKFLSASGKYSILVLIQSRLEISLHGSVWPLRIRTRNSNRYSVEESSRKFSFEVLYSSRKKLSERSPCFRSGKEKIHSDFVGQKVTVTTSDDSVANKNFRKRYFWWFPQGIPGGPEISVTNTENSLTVYELTVSGSVEGLKSEENKSAEIMGRRRFRNHGKNSSNGGRTWKISKSTKIFIRGGRWFV